MKKLGFLSNLILEFKHGKWVLSVGRVSWWLAFIPALKIWVESGGVQDISPHHSTILMILAAYNVGKHAVNGFGKEKENSNGPG